MTEIWELVALWLGLALIATLLSEIVVGHRGKSFFESWRLGLVSKHAIHYAHCAATVVR